MVFLHVATPVLELLPSQAGCQPHRQAALRGAADWLQFVRKLSDIVDQYFNDIPFSPLTDDGGMLMHPLVPKC